MKKILFVISAIVAISFASCGGNNSKTEVSANDSVCVDSVCVETVSVNVVDSVVDSVVTVAE